MDLSSILPLLMQKNGGGQTDTAAMIQALTSARSGASPGPGGAGQNANLMNMLSSLGGGKSQSPGGGMNPADLLSAFSNGGQGQNQNLNLVNLLSTLGKPGRNAKRPYGLKPVKAVIPDEFLGRIVKYFSRG